MSDRVSNAASGAESESVASVVVVDVVWSRSCTRTVVVPPTASRLPIAALRENVMTASSGVATVHVKPGDVHVLVPDARPPSSPESAE